MNPEWCNLTSKEAKNGQPVLHQHTRHDVHYWKPSRTFNIGDVSIFRQSSHRTTSFLKYSEHPVACELVIIQQSAIPNYWIFIDKKAITQWTIHYVTAFFICQPMQGQSITTTIILIRFVASSPGISPLTRRKSCKLCTCFFTRKGTLPYQSPDGAKVLQDTTNVKTASTPVTTYQSPDGANVLQD